MHHTERTCFFKLSFLPPSWSCRDLSKIVCFFFFWPKQMPSSSPQAEPCLWAGGERHSTSAEHMWVKSGCTHLPLVPFSICNELDAFLQAAINVCSGVMQFISYQCIWRITFHCKCIKPAGHLSNKKINMCFARSWKWTKSDFLLMQKNLYVFCLHWFI